MIRKFFREFFDESKLVLRAIPQGFKKFGVAIYKGTPKFFKNLAILKFKGIDNINDIEKYKGKDLLITREQAATFLYRTAEFLGNKTIKKTDINKLYDDETAISNWAKDYVACMNAMGIMKGVSERKFAPLDAYSVEQAIATMLRLYECG